MTRAAKSPTPVVRIEPMYLTRASAAAYLSMSISHFDALVSRGELPAPRQLSKGRVAWLVSDLTQWGLSRPASSSLPPANSHYGRAGGAKASKKSDSLASQSTLSAS